MIKVIIFDAAGTLFSSVSHPGRIQKILKSQGHNVELTEIERVLAASKRINKLLHDRELMKLDDEGYLLGSEIRMVLLGFDEKESRRLAEVFNKEWTASASRKPYPEVIKVLKSLHERKYKIGLLTAGTTSSYNETLKQFDMLKYFDFIAGEDTTNIPKPDPLAYKHVIEKAGCKPGEILFVGDNLINDYDCPRKSGMKSVLVDRENTHPDITSRITTLEPLLGKTYIDNLK